MEKDQEIQLAKYYVYILKDPRNESIFYVGKGTGCRANSHIKEAEKNEEKESKKISIINEIKRQNQEPKVLVIGRYETEPEALAVEATLIKWVYGLDTLSNLMQGHRHKSIRGKGVNKLIEGIDIPIKKIGARNGKYTEAQRVQIIENRVIEKLNWLKEELNKINIQTSEPDISKPQDPCIWIRNFHEHIYLQVKVQLSGNSVVLNLRPKSNDNPEHLKKFAEAQDLEIKGNGKYVPTHDFVTRNGYPRGIPIDSLGLIIKLIIETQKKLSLK